MPSSESEFAIYAENYSHCMQKLEEVMAHHAAAQESGGVLVFKISNFHAILHLYGHSHAHAIIAQLTDSITSALPVTSFVYRTNLNNFHIVLQNVSPSEIEEIAKNIHLLIQCFGYRISSSEPLHLLAVSGSSDFPASSISAKEILDKAYVALHYTQPTYNRRHVHYSAALKQLQQTKNQMILAHCFQKALIEKQLRLAFQPIINSKTGIIAYHESLLRMITEDGRIISAGPFIGAAEEMGFINAVDELVLEKVVEELRISPQITLAFNLSSLGIENDDWLQKAKTLLKDPEIASRAIIEITETAIQKDLGKAAYFVATLQDMGCQVALDDFGAGHTSFRQLKTLPVDIIKIDGSFIRDIVDNSDNRLFVRTLIDITKGFGLKAVAEFVETGEIAKLLMDLKVDYLQGNYFCPAVNYRSWIKEENM